MPFSSKAQQRYMFANHPAMAKRWADETKDIKNLPERTMNSHIKEGHFFRDMPGRDDGDFHKKAMFSYSQGQAPSGGGANVSPPGGTLFGTGEGAKKKKKPESEETPKEAGAAPSDWDASSDLPTGFHRPTKEQPEALEAGGERFHSSEDKPRDAGGSATRMGAKQARDMRFMGTPLYKSAVSGDDLYEGLNKLKRGASRKADDFAAGAKDLKETVKRRGGTAVRELDRGSSAALRHPAGAAAVLGIGGLLGYKGLRGAGRMIGKGFRPKAPPPTGVLAGAANKLKNLISGK